MNVINDYKSSAFYTFETSIIGKEYLRLNRGFSQIIIPGFQVELEFGDEIKCFKKQYFLFNDVSYFHARMSYFDTDIIDEYSIKFPLMGKVSNAKEVEIDSLMSREDTITFCTYTIQFGQLDIYYDEQIKDYLHVYYDVFNKIIEENNLHDFLCLREIPIKTDINLSEILKRM